MKILRETNTVFNLTDCPRGVSFAEFPPEFAEGINYCVLDYSDQNYVDFQFPDLVFIDEYTRSAAALKIGQYRIQVPLDWSVVIADKHSGGLELLDLKHVNDRDFQVFCFNPIEGYMPSFPDLEIDHIFPDVAWVVPKLTNGHILAVPLTDTHAPPCALFVKDTNKLPESLDITKIFG